MDWDATLIENSAVLGLASLNEAMFRGKSAA